MRLRQTIVAIAIFTVVCLSTAGAEVAEKIDQQLQTTLAVTPHDQFVDALLVLADNTDISTDVGLLARRQTNLTDRYQVVYAELQRRSVNSQASLLAHLQTRRQSGTIAEFKAYWITNAVYVRATPTEIEALAARDDISRIQADLRVGLIEPVSQTAAAAEDVGAADHLVAIGARALWDFGLTGEGRLVCSFDTGVMGSHPALADNWRGKYVADSSACWFDPFGTQVPDDLAGHGTHVMGLMVGSDGADTVGIAPQAQWICAAVVDRGEPLSKTISDILDAFQWAANPDGDPETSDDVPDVVCNSWGIPKGFMDQCSETFWNAIDNLESLGIVCIFAAGNEGPSSATMRNPADRATSPTNNFSVGSVDHRDPSLAVASFSSRGPSSCDLVSKKPEVVAPGVGIRSTYKDGGYKLISGTSMSAPLVAGAVALFRQYNPGLTPEQIKSAILLSAIDIGDPGEDNESGMGFIDLAAALALLPAPTIPAPQVTDIACSDAENNLLDPGESAELIVTLQGEVTDAFNLVGYLFTTTPGVQIDKDTSFFGTVPQGGEADNAADPFVVTTASSMSIGDTITFILTLVGDTIPTYLQRECTLVLGVPYNGRWTTLNSNAVAMTVSNFGTFGLHDNSYVPLGGRGYDIPALDGNYLYEAGLLVKAGSGPVSDEVRRDGLGTYDGDFRPASAADFDRIIPGTVGDEEMLTTFDDSGANVPLGVTIEQRVAAFTASPGADGLLLEWNVHNNSGADLNDVCVALFTDWDLPDTPSADRIVVDADEDLYYQHRTSAGAVVGVALLNVTMTTATFFDNGPSKRGFTEFEKYQALTAPISAPDPAQAADWCGFVGAGPYDLSDGDSVTIAFAVCSGATVGEFYEAVIEVRNRYLLSTGVVEDETILPRDHEIDLKQNYPNPFNPETRIEFSLAEPGDVNIAVFNMIGQRVTTIHSGFLTAGDHAVVWTGQNDAGERVASGIYLYRVSTATQSKTRKMVLLR